MANGPERINCWMEYKLLQMSLQATSSGHLKQNSFYLAVSLEAEFFLTVLPVGRREMG